MQNEITAWCNVISCFKGANSPIFTIIYISKDKKRGDAKFRALLRLHRKYGGRIDIIALDFAALSLSPEEQNLRPEPQRGKKKTKPSSRYSFLLGNACSCSCRPFLLSKLAPLATFSRAFYNIIKSSFFDCCYRGLYLLHGDFIQLRYGF